MSNRNRLVAVTVSLAVLAAAGCDRRESTGSSGPVAGAVQDASGQTSTLPTPFTAEQIRDEWIVGFEVLMKRNGPEGEFLERWRVLDTDAQTVSIEGAVVDALGQPIDEPQVGRSGWDELRDHAAFPVDRGTRAREIRQTALGELEGWLYIVSDPDGEGAMHYFFADSLPGAPVQVQVVSGGQVETVFEQLERFRPESADHD